MSFDAAKDDLAANLATRPKSDSLTESGILLDKVSEGYLTRRTAVILLLFFLGKRGYKSACRFVSVYFLERHRPLCSSFLVRNHGAAQSTLLVMGLRGFSPSSLPSSKLMLSASPAPDPQECRAREEPEEGCLEKLAKGQADKGGG